MFGFFQVLLVLMFEFDIVLDIIFDLFMFLSECSFKVVDFVLFLLKVIADSCVVFFVSFQFLLQNRVLFVHLVYEGFYLYYFFVYL